MADADEKSDDEGSIFKVDTVPPPAGDGDAYNAPTKVGPVSAEAWVELMKQADATAKKASDAQESLEDAGPHSRPPNSRQPASVPKPAPASGGATSASAASASAASSTTNDDAPPASTQPPPGDVPRVYDSEDSDENAATMLNPNAKNLVDSGARADASVFGAMAAMIPGPQAEEQPAPQSVLGPPRRQTEYFPMAIMACFMIFAAGLVYYLFSN